MKALEVPIRSVAALASELGALGVRRGDMLMVHASLRAIGPVENGADGVIDALHSALGDEGTLLMILGAEIEHDFVDELPEAERIRLLEDAPPFNPALTPAYGEVGTLAEIFRRRQGTLVTDNPCGRFGARGALARELTADAPWHDYYGPGSPLERLCNQGGKIIRLGAGPDTTTALHLAEYRADLPQKRKVRRHYRCLGVSGPETRLVECLDDSTGIVDWPGEDYFATILRDYLATGRARQGMVGNAASELIDAEHLVTFGAAWMTARFADASLHGNPPSGRF